ncbi:MAG TPA: thioredoxin family protein [Pyrinomonadaceae bacterium]|nr:thioredoxin family protein [Pyrinomonadaceae bacterium]
MRKQSVISLLLAAIFAIVAVANVTNHNARATTPDVPAALAIGSTVPEFSLPDADGKTQSLSSLKGKNGTVFIFVAVQCPVSNAYNERMEKLAQDYKARGINVVGINSNVAEPAEAVKAHATTNKLTFPILKDPGNKIADQLGATVTPEAYVLDASNKLIYRGRIDNSRKGDSITATELRDALEASLVGKPVSKEIAAAFGCSIKRA